ncbi:28S ribosomal protein S35, mitochondrial [Thalassophryne amazonica]|uniref:28S ribosomal protein S35, mitochondrial n=1 Tax=Thalassophryne amazonica TaxID=390379 RepID=UPI001470C0AE|nr:28S ribosomal protein S35, mitochondrial [Thalassophryne amazonica]
MAYHTCKAFMSFRRINVLGVVLQSSGSKLIYVRALSMTAPFGKEGLSATNRRSSVGKPKRDTLKPRTENMAVDQDWTSVYPAAASFRATSVPLPVRMGHPAGGVHPDKTGNLELLKIPNFLHLTPTAIKKHCEALKAFCTEWPSGLDTDAKCDQLFPIKIESADYVSAGPSVRNLSARIVNLKVKLSSLNLDEHAWKKMVKLVGERYCKDTDILTITADSCPLRQQNYDYAMYLLTVLYHESWKIEAWEAEKTAADMEEYMWEDSPSQKNILDVLTCMEVAGEEHQREHLLGRREVQEYKDSVIRLKNEGDSETSVLQYKEAVKKVLNL